MNIAKLHFTDAFYGTEKRGEFIFVSGEAYGFCEERGSELRLHFIRRVKRPSLFRRVFYKDYLLKGLIIPNSAIWSNAVGFKGERFKVGEEVSVRWFDMVHVENDHRRGVSVMKTSGVVDIDEGDFVVLRRPKTVRQTRPQRKHPEVNPDYYFIPKALIFKDVKVTPIIGGGSHSDDNEVSMVRFMRNGVEYEGVGVIFDKGEEVRVAFSAINDEVVDFLDIDKDEIVSLKTLKPEDVISYR